MLNNSFNFDASSRHVNDNFLVATSLTGQSQKMISGNLPELLKSRNADAHRTLEQVVDVMNPAFTLSDYSMLINRFYGFIKPWEDQLRSALPEVLVPLFAGRYKAPWLRQDLQDLQTRNNSRILPTTDSSPALCSKLPDVSTTARLLGSAYVIEGSSLGGRLIVSHLERSFGSGTSVPHRYFYCYGSQTGSMWKKYLATLTALVPEENYPDALDAAAQTFACMTDWFSGIKRQPLACHD